jgi:ubiquinone/menaquinone biosynthesis C-methylase UbiE
MECGNRSRFSEPHVQWGIRLIDRLPLAGDELVLDVGCGTGKLTQRLLPNGRALTVDQSVNMLDTARRYLTPRCRAQFTIILDHEDTKKTVTSGDERSLSR